MLKFLFLSASVALSAPAISIELNTGSGENVSGVTSNTSLPLVPTIQPNKSSPLKKSFQSNEVEGWLQSNGDWFIKGTVTHQRLRCATYQLGIKLGKGNPGCLNVEWVSDVQYGTMQQQCNSAPVLHTGGGNMPELQNLLQKASCVQVVVKCTGQCQ
jgi:hypothetical protein